MFGSKVFSAVVVTSTLLAGVEAVCMTVPFRTGVGRDTGKYDDKSDWCGSQQDVCSIICQRSGGKVYKNTCDFLSNTSFCYECACTFPGTDYVEPELEPYYGTIPMLSCQLDRSNCASTPGLGASDVCDRYKCGKLYLFGDSPDQVLQIPGAPVGAAPPPTSTLSEVVPVPTTTPVVPAPLPLTGSSTSTTTSSTSVVGTTSTSILLTTSSTTAIVTSILNATTSTSSTVLPQTTLAPVLNSTISSALPTLKSTSTRLPSPTATPLKEAGASMLQGAGYLSAVMAFALVLL